MKRIAIQLIILIALLLFVAVHTEAQVYLKTEYIAPSTFQHEDNGHKLDGKGGLKTIEGGIQLPVSMQINEHGRPTAWVLALGGTYASLGNESWYNEYCVSEILNAQAGVMHLRPFSEKWSILAMAGVGIFTSDMNKFSGRSILGQGGLLFINHVNKAFDWGVGLALNNALGYPMIFPSFYLDWKLEGKYEFKLSMYNSFGIGVSTHLNEHFKLSLVGEAKGIMAAVKKEEKNMYFTTQYAYVGIQPELKLSKSFSIPFTCGVSFTSMYFQEANLKSFFSDKNMDPYQGISVYLSTGIKYGF